MDVNWNIWNLLILNLIKMREPIACKLCPGGTEKIIDDEFHGFYFTSYLGGGGGGGGRAAGLLPQQKILFWS